MASRFIGRDYSSLRYEIIQFLRERLPKEWDYTNLADPVVIYAETLARIGDQLHFTIDELRRECDISTAQRSSSIYSYALREGYNMMLPRSSFGQLIISANKEFNAGGKVRLDISKFDEIKIGSTGDILYAVDDIHSVLYSQLDDDYISNLSNFISEDGTITDENISKRNIYARYSSTIYNRSIHLNVVAGKKIEFKFSYKDINSDSTVTLPSPMIDRTLFRLTYKDASNSSDVVMNYVTDVISSGFNLNSFSLVPKFIGGAITLCIEFPTNYSDIFKEDATFKFECIQIMDKFVEGSDENAETIDLSNYISLVNESDTETDLATSYIIDLGNGIKGYSEYEDPAFTREHYKKYIHDYSSLLTKDNYATYIKTAYSSYCNVFDHADNYKDILPANTVLMPRVIYISTDDAYSARKAMWEDLIERSSRSDCIVMVPFGKDPYTIVVKADCYLLGTSASSIATKIQSDLIQYYGKTIGERVPETSMINYLVHKSSDKVIRMDSLIVRDSTFGTIDTTFANIINLSNDEIDSLYSSLESENYNYSISTSRTDSDGNMYIDTVYPFRGEYIKDGVTYYYNKYPIWDYMKRRNNQLSSDNYPFPKIWVLVKYNSDNPDSSNEHQIEDYDDLIKYQTSYGALDTKEWDLNDEDIFEMHKHKGYSYKDYTQVKYIANGDSKFGFVKNEDIDTESNIIKTGSDVFNRDLSIAIDIIDHDTTIADSLPGLLLKCDYNYEETDVSGNTATVTKSGYIDPSKIDSDHKVVFGGASLYSSNDISTKEVVQELEAGSNLSNIINTEHEYDIAIKRYYVKHHYMIPVLNNVVVLVRAISK